MNLFIFQLLNATNIGNGEMPLLGVNALALSKAYKIQIRSDIKLAPMEEGKQK
jgi:hypothetical protein